MRVDPRFVSHSALRREHVVFNLLSILLGAIHTFFLLSIFVVIFLLQALTYLRVAIFSSSALEMDQHSFAAAQ